jgi:hypothetical protein
VDPSVCITSWNSQLPKGIQIEEARFYPIVEGKKQRSIGSLEWGSEYEIRSMDPTDVSLIFEKLSGELVRRQVSDYRISREESRVIKLRLRLPANKEHGLIKILESCTEIRPIQMAFKIIKTLFLANSGIDESPVSIFSAYEIVS